MELQFEIEFEFDFGCWVGDEDSAFEYISNIKISIKKHRELLKIHLPYFKQLSILFK